MKSGARFCFVAVSALFGAVVGWVGTASFQGSEDSTLIASIFGAAAPTRETEASVRHWTPPPSFRAELGEMLAAARAGGSDSGRLTKLQEGVDRWLLSEPLECIAWLQTRGALGLVRWDLLGNVFASAFRGDLALAIAAGREIVDHRLRHAWLMAAFDEAMETTPARTLELLDALPEGWRDEVARDLSSRWAEKDGRAAWQAMVVERNAADEAPTWAGDILQSWARVDPQGLQAFILEKLAQPASGRDADDFRYALQTLATTEHPEVALAALSGLERDPDLQNSWMNALGHAGAFDNVDAMRRSIAAEPGGLRRDFALTWLARSVAQRQPSVALAWVAEVPSARARDIVVRSVLENTMQSGNQTEAADLAQSEPNLLRRAEQMELVVEKWLKQTPNELVEFALTAPEPERGASWLDILASATARGKGIAPSSGEAPPFDRALLQRLEPELARRLPAGQFEAVRGTLFGPR